MFQSYTCLYLLVQVSEALQFVFDHQDLNNGIVFFDGATNKNKSNYPYEVIAESYSSTESSIQFESKQTILIKYDNLAFVSIVH